MAQLAAIIGITHNPFLLRGFAEAVWLPQTPREELVKTTRIKLKKSVIPTLKPKPYMDPGRE